MYQICTNFVPSWYIGVGKGPVVMHRLCTSYAHSWCNTGERLRMTKLKAIERARPNVSEKILGGDFERA